ncbi:MULTISPECIES: DUF7313 family protein [Saliphagus]|uniref:DUF7313 domain-containing protein n=1 Tax=Saliphagus infecundisoli TaxID=1849069 RepID=A0ABD5QF17_9EURY|nr:MULTISPECIES: hypothetical protein [Saliphagus]
MITSSLFGPIDVLAQEVVSGVAAIEFVLLVVVVANLAIRALAYRDYASAAREGGAEAITRSTALDATNVALVLGSFYYITVHLHGGVVLTTLVLALVIADVFEFEARLVEARTERPIERPNGALFASALVFAYIAYQSLFFIVSPVWDAIV